MAKRSSKNLVPQENPMGCAVACVASQCRIKYHEALQLFDRPDFSWTRGFYASEVVTALAEFNLDYDFEKFENKKHESQLNQPGTFIFTEANSRYPSGHYFLRLKTGWMNPWANFPHMKPVKSALEKEIQGRILYVIFKKKF